MQRLSPAMMARYEIEDHRPKKITAATFGTSDLMLGAVHRALDDQNTGVAWVETGSDGYAPRLKAQGGLYTLIIRGYRGEEAVNREQVIQCVKKIITSDEIDQLLAEADIETVIVDDDAESRRLAQHFIAEYGKPLKIYSLGAMPGALPISADSLVFRGEPDEAAMLCKNMNYLDEMLYIAEPYCRIARDETYERMHRLKTQVFDTGIFLMSALGWLNGLDTLNDCMNCERLRRFVGEAFTGELMSAFPDIDQEYIIECFERYSNPLNRNRILRASQNMLSRFLEGPARVIRQIANRDFEPPRRLSFALAATVMLYSGARKNPKTGIYEVMRGNTVEAIHDESERLEIFSTLSHDMPPEALAYAVLADRELWQGNDFREIEGLESRLSLDIAAIQRDPGFIPDTILNSK